VKKEIVVHSKKIVGRIHQQAMKLCSEVECALKVNNFLIRQLEKSSEVFTNDKDVDDAKYLLEQKKTQDIIEETEEVLCRLYKFNNSMLFNIYSARSMYGSIKYLKFEAATGENIFGNLSSSGPNTDDSTPAKEPTAWPEYICGSNTDDSDSHSDSHSDSYSDSHSDSHSDY
jgi:hypothetical protein